MEIPLSTSVSSSHAGGRQAGTRHAYQASKLQKESQTSANPCPPLNVSSGACLRSSLDWGRWLEGATSGPAGGGAAAEAAVVAAAAKATAYSGRSRRERIATFKTLEQV